MYVLVNGEGQGKKKKISFFFLYKVVDNSIFQQIIMKRTYKAALVRRPV